jgi:predicted phosphodiesterase
MNEENSIFLQEVINEIKGILDANKIDPAELTLPLYKKCGGICDGRSLRKLGGFSAIMNEAFRPDLEQDYGTVRYLSRRRNYVNKLQKELGDWKSLEKEVYESFTRAFNESKPVKISKLIKPPLPVKFDRIRENCIFLSDTHFGLTIDKAEVVTNEFNWKTAAGRLGALAEQVASYKINHREDCPQLRICLGGDLIQGLIHWESDVGTDLITRQVKGAGDYIIQFIDYLRHHYNSIVVECVSGNHDRVTHKGKDRVTAQKFDSFASMIYIMIQLAFRDIEDVQVNISKAPIVTFDILGHTFGMSHGDSHIRSGNIGSSITIGKITEQILKLNQCGQMYDAILLGHIHTACYLPTLPGTRTALIINGTLSGTDSYASSVGFFMTTPQQMLFEVTNKVAVGDLRVLNLDEFCLRHLDIIKPYSTETDL